MRPYKIPHPKAPQPHQRFAPRWHLRPAELSPSSSPRSAGTNDATGWHVFPGLPKQPQKHNKQQQHTADSRQTFPSYLRSVCAFPPLPRGSCCHRKGTTILFFKPAPSQQEPRCKARGARNAAPSGEKPGKSALNPESQARAAHLPPGCRRQGLWNRVTRAVPMQCWPSGVNPSSWALRSFPGLLGCPGLRV